MLDKISLHKHFLPRKALLHYATYTRKFIQEHCWMSSFADCYCVPFALHLRSAITGTHPDNEICIISLVLQHFANALAVFY